MPDVVDLAHFRSQRSASAAAGEDPVSAALAALPLTAGLATRVRAIIEAGASDVYVDCYVAAWVDSARADIDANRSLHFEIGAHLGGLS